MSKRWKWRKKNAEKLEHSRNVINEFYDRVVSELQQAQEKLAKYVEHTEQAKGKGGAHE